MKIEHMAVWTQDAKSLIAFYETYLNGELLEQHRDVDTGFFSCFIGFSGGARLEIMQAEDVENRLGSLLERCVGLTHLAFRVDAKEEIDLMAQRFLDGGFELEKEPMEMDDGYYECSVFDPDRNIIEFTFKPDLET